MSAFEAIKTVHIIAPSKIRLMSEDLHKLVYVKHHVPSSYKEHIGVVVRMSILDTKG